MLDGVTDSMDVSLSELPELVTVSVIYHEHLRMKCSPGISKFLAEVCDLPHSIILHCFPAGSLEAGLLTPARYALRSVRCYCCPCVCPGLLQSLQRCG